MSDMLRWSGEAAGLGKLMSVGFWAVVVRSVAAKVGDVGAQVLAGQVRASEALPRPLLLARAVAAGKREEQISSAAARHLLLLVMRRCR